MGKPQSVKSKILNIGKMFATSKKQMKADSGDAVPVDTGTYAMQLVKADIAEVKGEPKLITAWCVLDEGDEQHKLCKQFDTINAEKYHWILKLLTQLGIDVDETGLSDDEATTETLIDVLNEKIEDQTIARVQVTEKDGYRNMRVKGVHPEADDFTTVDPAEAIGGKVSASSSQEDDADEAADDEEEEKPVDNKYKNASQATKAPKSDGRKVQRKDDKEEESEEPVFAEGDRVTFENDDGDEVEGEIVGIIGDDARVRKDGEKKAQIRPLDMLTKLDAEEDDTSDDDTAEEVEDEPVEVKVGSKVIVTIKGKDKSGVIKKILDDGEKFLVKVGNEAVTVKADAVSVEVDE